MRTYDNDLLAAKNAAENNELIKLKLKLDFYLNFFREKLNQLNKILFELDIDIAANEEKVVSVLKEKKTLETYVETLKTYMTQIQSSSVLCFKTKKMSDSDMANLKLQVISLEKMYSLLQLKSEDAAKRASNDSVDSENRAESTASNEANETKKENQKKDKLSELIDDAKNLEHKVSYTRVWLRRGALLLGSLLAAAAAVALAAAFLTPGVNVIAALAMVPVTIASMLAFFYLRNPVTTDAQINVAGYSVHMAATVPSTLSSAGAFFMGISKFKKLPITNKPREIAARNMGIATTNLYADELKKKIQQLQCDDSGVKSFLLSTLDKADRMYNDGASKGCYELRSSKMLKAHLILRETAKIVEDKKTLSADVNTLLNRAIDKTSYTYGQLLNAQRNKSTFWMRTSSFASGLISSQKIDRRAFGASVSLQAIAAC